MKKVSVCILAVLLIISSFSANAQHLENRKKPKDRKYAMGRSLINSIIGNGNPVTAYKTTSPSAERLIATSNYGMNFDSTETVLLWLHTDSAQYKYSGTRGSHFNFNSMKFNNGFYIDGRTYMGASSIAPFVVRNNQPDVLSDTVNIWTGNNPPFVYGHYESMYAAYDGYNNILNYFNLYDDYHNYQQYINAYNADGSIATSLNLSALVSTWDTSQFRSFTYSGGSITADSTKMWGGAGVWAPKESNIYTFNSDGDLLRVDFNINSTPTSAAEWYRYDLTYYAPHQLKTITTTDMILSNITEVDSLGWTPGVTYCTYAQGIQYSGGEVYDSSVTIKHVSASSGLPDTTYTYIRWAGTFFTYSTVYTYDSYNMPVLGTEYIPGTTGAYDSLYALDHYYYENYYPTAVPQTNTPVSIIFIYPNPATDHIFISAEKAGLNTGTVRIINMMGQTVAEHKINLSSGISSISVKDLSTGVYWVSVYDENGSVLGRGKLQKL